MTKVHELELSPVIRYVPFIVLGMVSLVFLGAILFGGPKGPPPVILLILLPVFALQLWMMLTQVHRVIVHEDGTLEWVALARTIRVRPESVLKIGPDRSGAVGYFALTHTEGKIRFINQINGFHEILNLIEARNPRVELKGC
jgi:hypothetical protein